MLFLKGSFFSWPKKMMKNWGPLTVQTLHQPKYIHIPKSCVEPVACTILDMASVEQTRRKITDKKLNPSDLPLSTTKPSGNFCPVKPSTVDSTVRCPGDTFEVLSLQILIETRCLHFSRSLLMGFWDQISVQKNLITKR